MTSDKSTVWILDSSALIEMKTVAVRDQWHVFRRMEDMVCDGEVALPRQVINELREVAHPDVPGVWASGMRRSLRHPQDADHHDLRRVMSDAGEVVDSSKRTDDADPHVLALALTLSNTGHAVCVVAEDVVDRQRLSIATACKRLGLPLAASAEFLDRSGLVPLKKPG